MAKSIPHLPWKELCAGLLPVRLNSHLTACFELACSISWVGLVGQPTADLISTSSTWPKVHKRYAPQDHWYLWAIGVDIGSQGKGIGGGLLQPVLVSASATKTLCYLETHNERNVRFYEKHGFSVVSEGCVPQGGPQVWAMLREPQQSAHT